jgi:1-aminocyclopropane-1-carboxylate deaminase/D-cysteine desulfhydrase-like pyridoxal-dependent ACC family enzyme
MSASVASISRAVSQWLVASKSQSNTKTKQSKSKNKDDGDVNCNYARKYCILNFHVYQVIRKHSTLLGIIVRPVYRIT